MMRIRSSTLCKLLYGAVGTLAVALLGLVALMVYTTLAPAESHINTSPAPPTAAARGAQVSIARASANLEERLFGRDEEEEEIEFSDAKESHDGYVYVGSIVESTGDKYALLQKRPQGGSFLLPVNGESEEVTLLGIDAEHIRAEINGERVTLTLQQASAASSAGRSRMGRRPSRTGRTTPGSTSYRLAGAKQNVEKNPDGSPKEGGGRDWRTYWQQRMRRLREQRQND